MPSATQHPRLGFAVKLLGRPERRSHDGRLVLVTGATGYIGSQLIGRLVAEGYRVRAMGRRLEGLLSRRWSDQVELAAADVLRPEGLAATLHGVDTAYYLIHSMSSGDDFHQQDLRAARNFGRAASQAGVRRLIYLGALGNEQQSLSPHLASRQATGHALRESGVPVTEFRAAVVVGAGSLSFEVVRYLTEHIPVMVCPRWVYTRTQPIAVENCLDYLVGALEQPQSIGRVIEIGGEQVLTYGEMMTGYARVRGLQRWLLPVPVLTPRLSSYWVHLVTPIQADIAQPLIEGLRSEVVVRDDSARRMFPEITLLDYPSAVRRALHELERPVLDEQPADPPPVQVSWQRGLIIERHSASADVSAVGLYRAFSELGGAQGWLAYNWAWRLRGALDRLLGGVGLRREARLPRELQAGEVLDFWRVETVEPEKRLRLRAEMKLPGQAWLEFEVERLPGGQQRLHLTAIFAPKGLSGLLYWMLLYPIHRLIFHRLHRKLIERAGLLDAEARQQEANRRSASDAA